MNALIWYSIVNTFLCVLMLLIGIELGVGSLCYFLQREEYRNWANRILAKYENGSEFFSLIIIILLCSGIQISSEEESREFLSYFLFGVIFLILRRIIMVARYSFLNYHWVKMWDLIYSLVSIIILFLLGICIGNIFEKRVFIYKIFFGITVCIFFMLYGATYLYLKAANHHETNIENIVQYIIRNIVVLFQFFFTLLVVSTLLFVTEKNTIHLNTFPVIIGILCISLLNFGILFLALNKIQKFPFVLIIISSMINFVIISMVIFTKVKLYIQPFYMVPIEFREPLFWMVGIIGTLFIGIMVQWRIRIFIINLKST